jgi:hypothetical protein
MSGRWGGKHDLSFEQYHTIPEEWDAPSVLVAHQAMRGTFDIGSTPRNAFGARGTTSYRAIWYNISDGVRAGDSACVELAVRFIEEHLVVSYSGFARTRLARALRHAELSAQQRRRLSSHFLKLLETGNRCEEYSEYLKLWPLVVTPADRKRALGIAAELSHPQEEFRRKLENAFK